MLFYVQQKACSTCSCKAHSLIHIANYSQLLHERLFTKILTTENYLHTSLLLNINKLEIFKQNPPILKFRFV